jgi:hypothetical protein
MVIAFWLCSILSGGFRLGWLGNWLDIRLLDSWNWSNTGIELSNSKKTKPHSISKAGFKQFVQFEKF